MFRRLRGTMGNANVAIDQNQAMMKKGDALLDDLAELFDKLEADGIDLSLEIAGRKIPVKLMIDVGQEE